MAASCTAWNTPESTLVFTLPSPAISSGWPTAKPTRQPVMLKVFESEWNSIATSRPPGSSRMLGGRSPK